MNRLELIDGEIALRRYNSANYENTVNWLNLTEIRDAFGLTYTINLESHKKWIQSLDEFTELLAIYVKEEHVGDIVLKHNQKHFSTYFQIYIGNTKFQSKGIGFVAVSLAIKFIFEVKNYHRIHLHVGPTNLAAKNLYKKAGFQFEGLERDSVFSNGIFKDQERWALLNTGKNQK